MNNIYHFVAAQKLTHIAEGFIETLLKKNLPNNKLNQEVLHDFEEYSKMYGIEATIIAVFLRYQEFNHIIKIEKSDVFAGWKMMNKLWQLLNKNSEISAYSPKFESQEDQKLFEKYIERMQVSLAKKAMHIYISSVFHILKTFKHSQLNESAKVQLLTHISEVLPCIGNFHAQRLANSKVDC